MAGEEAAIISVVLVLFAAWAIYLSVNVVREKEVLVIERLGKFRVVLPAGVHFVVPFIDWPKTYTWRYFVSDPVSEKADLVTKVNAKKISTTQEVLDFPRQRVITRDNAMILIDAVLNWRVINAKQMMYNSQNLPDMLSKVLQAQLRNVAGSLDVDQIIEDTAAMDRVSGDMDQVAQRWGVKIEFVKIQRVDAEALTSVLARKKNADLKNQEIIINAKARKQTQVIESEGIRDRMIREAEGEAQQVLSRARGEAQAILNNAKAEARSVKEIARAVARSGENPIRYLLALKYVDALQKVMGQPDTMVKFVPSTTAVVMTAELFGLNTVAPPAPAA